MAAKTMPPDPDGIVDILVPLYLVLPPQNGGGPFSEQLVRHSAAHEAVHATIHHLGSEPFDVHQREEFGYASLQFVGMASEQVEEHLAEYVAGEIVPPLGTTTDDLEAAFAAWIDAIEVQLPAIPEDDPDHFGKGMMVCFEALHILWKVLAYFAAEIRNGATFGTVLPAIAVLRGWRDHVEPWWAEYTRLLGLIPMSLEIDIAAIDNVVKELALHLQRWALGLGFDFRDTTQGAWFRITHWD